MDYIVATDLDGTLLDNTGEISAYTRSVIEKLLDSGITIIPCTARSTNDLPKSLLETDIRYFVCTNGSVIYDKETQKPIKSYLLDTKIALEIVDKLDLERIFVNVIYDGEVYSEYRLYDASVEAGLYDKEHAQRIKNGRSSVESTYDLLKKLSKIDKLHMDFLTKEERDKARDIIGQSEHFLVQSSGDLNLEITNINTDKGRAAQYVSKMLDVDHKKLLAFGDNLNDVPLLEVADISVRMSNGIDTLRHHAKHVTDFNNHDDGVAKFIHKVIFE